jgi:DNA polymerase-3 subunit beta
MYVVCSSEALAKGILVVSRGVNRRTALPILHNVLLTADPNYGLRLFSTDLETTLIAYVDGEVKLPGTTTLPGDLLGEIGGTLGKGETSLKLNDKNYSVEILAADIFAMTLNGISASEYPQISLPDSDKVLKIAKNELKSALSQVVIATSSDESRPVLMSVEFSFAEGKMQMVATDGHRLALAIVNIEGDVAGLKNLLVPSRSLREVLRLLSGEGSCKIQIGKDGLQLFFVMDGIQIGVRLIDGTFPDYRRVIPDKHVSLIKLKAKEMESMVKTMALFTVGAPLLKLNSNGQSLSLKAGSEEIGESVAALSCEIEGEEVSVTLNPRYLAESLAVMGGEIEMWINGALSPVLLKTAGVDRATHVIMPVRTAS